MHINAEHAHDVTYAQKSVLLSDVMLDRGKDASRLLSPTPPLLLLSPVETSLNSIQLHATALGGECQKCVWRISHLCSSYAKAELLSPNRLHRVQFTIAHKL